MEERPGDAPESDRKDVFDAGANSPRVLEEGDRRQGWSPDTNFSQVCVTMGNIQAAPALSSHKKGNQNEHRVSGLGYGSARQKVTRSG
ncbi:hypothetical protein KOW79_022047 [Hemibagrus wyckioides]|uniref:Uncharacterized protein n=1 Tax=Hemibagrus wyckioides TaxID=337641 RepID=A0A9D3N4M2_9TELE|nr:hypothetical protein KOW79_022047 [Hemibagrus wyckioides]